ncbi:tryptase [Lates calcarifer]|uniref:Tryptase n=1 Tax=Lates calcarifer TaxID=8187 RepID=A0AAJ8BEC4_LATCA|nr:tryptase [Lates calcarifer]
MALHQFLCGFTVVIILLSKGCQSQECGKAPRNTRIVGGQNAPPGSWPWQVILIKDNGDLCGGSLINDQWVLTSSSCIKGSPNITVILGRHSQSGPSNDEVSLGVSQIILHPSFGFIFNDIALLELSASVNFTDYIRPVCLASADSTFHTGTNSWVTGWGVTLPNGSTFPDILQEVKVPIVGNNECQCYHKKYFITENMICAGLKAGGKDSCQGDSGGPLVTKLDDSWVQSGVVSFGEGCAVPNIPGVYTRVSKYEEWIRKNIGTNRAGFVTFKSPGVDSDLNFTCSTSPPATTTTTTYTTAPTNTATTTETTTTTNAANTTITDTTLTNTATTTAITTTTSDNKGGDSVFDGGENVIHFSHFTSLCALVLSLFVLAGDA